MGPVGFVIVRSKTRIHHGMDHLAVGRPQGVDGAGQKVDGDVKGKLGASI